MWKPRPSATSAKPIINRKASASMRVVGWREMKPETAPEAAYMMATATTTAAIITPMCSAMPMAVTIELTEKTRSMTMICETIMAKPAPVVASAPCSPAAASTSLWISRVALTSRKKPPASRTRSRQEKA